MNIHKKVFFVLKILHFFILQKTRGVLQRRCTENFCKIYKCLFFTPWFSGDIGFLVFCGIFKNAFFIEHFRWLLFIFSSSPLSSPVCPLQEELTEDKFQRPFCHNVSKRYLKTTHIVGHLG